MKSAFIRVFGAFAVLLLIVICVGYWIPRDYDIRSEIKIDAPAPVVFAQINTLENWQHWSPWNSDDVTGYGVKYRGPASGEGAIQTWSDPRGAGTLWLTSSTPFDKIDYEMEFTGFPKLVGQFELTADGDQTTLSWSSSGTLPSGPFYGYLSGQFKGGMEQQYLAGLMKLKSHVESLEPESLEPVEPAGETGEPADR